jgi:hypothetical protein
MDLSFAPRPVHYCLALAGHNSAKCNEAKLGLSLPRSLPATWCSHLFLPKWPDTVNTGQIPPPLDDHSPRLHRHRIGPDSLNSLLGEDKLNNFRASLGDKDVIHVVQFDDPSGVDYCDQTLYMVAFVILTAGW